jgi:DNA repair protein RecN (Recombination protein N)
LERCSEKLINDPEQLEQVNQNYNLFILQIMNTVEELCNSISAWKFCFELGNLESEIEKLKVAIQQKKRILIKKASEIHSNRQIAIPLLSEKLILF